MRIYGVKDKARVNLREGGEETGWPEPGRTVQFEDPGLSPKGKVCVGLLCGDLYGEAYPGLAKSSQHLDRLSLLQTVAPSGHIILIICHPHEKVFQGLFPV